ncbi:hypothetical protein [Mycobacterium botniense]|uniref:Antitoxin HicB n=1 Tax=Mycobacterium botniense TaxID=84962 RepID=A0A7I9XY48_9MYCO|nr:hypothetical protein [Mycobacterium botniense]GFG74708.1 hypothetical protein MBOT_20730 [Mycobacterium botniense]GFG74737.1 hypothetical protein MBOT_21020 [Mycobacterium botniense]
MKTYTAIASPDEGRWWFIRIPGLGNNPDEGLPTQARRLTDVEPMARDLIAVYLDVPEDSFNVEVKIELPTSVSAHLQHADELRRRAAQAQTEAAAEYRAAARELKANGLTVRDIGKVLDVSHQRAQQLVHSA